MNPVERKVKVQVPETQWREVPADKDCPNPTPQRCPVTVLREEERTVCLEEPALVWSTTKCQIDYCVKVPKTKKTVCTEDTVWKLEPVEKTAARSPPACPRSSSSRTKSPSAEWCRRPCSAARGAATAPAASDVAAAAVTPARPPYGGAGYVSVGADYS